MYSEHYKVSKKVWQTYESLKLWSMLQSSKDMVGYTHATIGEEIDIVIFWRLP